MTLESRFTAAGPDCPHPEWWHSPDDDSAETEVSELVGAFVRALQPELVVETGSAFGYTAATIAVALERNGHGQLVTLEPDPERAAAARERLQAWPFVTVVERSSMAWTPPSSIDFAWLDSLLDLRVQELVHFRPYLSTGAIVGIHDASPFHGHRAVFEDAMNAARVRPIYLRTPRGVLFGEVL